MPGELEVVCLPVSRAARPGGRALRGRRYLLSPISYLHSSLWTPNYSCFGAGICRDTANMIPISAMWIHNAVPP